MTHTIEVDYLVIGSGVAGLSLAIEAASHGSVAVITKRGIGDTNTAWAQGGIAAVLDPSDSFEDHVRDTLIAGNGICHRSIVEGIVRDGPARIDALRSFGARFSRTDPGNTKAPLDLTREGGHQARRVVHAGDMTGQEVQRALSEAAAQSTNIEVHEGRMAIDLIELSRLGGSTGVVGAYALDESSGKVFTYLARATILATGGAGKVYLYTSNPDVATGDGVAMAYRAGAEIANMEFFQFHPTCLFHPEARTFLISEALRGEGGILRLANGRAFMEDHHEMKGLAPRDIVARAIDLEMKRTGQECVFLDMSARDSAYLIDRFPNIHETCLRFGVDMTKDPIPVVPAAHYMCGGIVVDEHGKSSVEGLWAIGEVSCTGLHGANRLASNSLLEGLVYGKRTAASIRDYRPDWHAPSVPSWDIGEAVPSDEQVVVTQNWDEIRRLMWNYVGIVRSDRRLRRASRRIALLQEEIRDYYWNNLVNRDLLELRNIATVAELIIACAAARHESRGLHFTLDYPEPSDQFAGDTRTRWASPPTIEKSTR